MAQYDYHELKHSKVSDLRDIASKLDPPVQGYSQLNKDHLVEAICKQLGIEMHERHQVQGIDKGPIKKQLRELRKSRDEAEAAHDSKKLKQLRRRMHGLKRTLRRSMV